MMSALYRVAGRLTVFARRRSAGGGRGRRGLVVAAAVLSGAAAASTVQTRIDRDIGRGEPVVVHVSVALADNENQWIVPVPEAIGNGQDPRNNLYWGARYGLKTFLLRDGGWRRVAAPGADNPGILERLVLTKRFPRGGGEARVYLVADAWDGARIGDTLEQFLRYSAGHDPEPLALADGTRIAAGGAAYAQVYIGHNALMDYFGARDKATGTPDPHPDKPDNDAIVLACKSEPYFRARLDALGARPLVLTTGLMAPEAYSLDAALSAWIAGGPDNAVRRAAAGAYARYQKAPVKWARRLFGAE